ncbi:MAG: hypothetical protein QNJ55_30845 [Xenococcus sp. MO_188.B8]|nr:hypothetical protein [Xenococcus sp. MO_188.B8]
MTDLLTSTLARGVLTNIATEILVSHAQSLEDTVAGRMLKWAGLIEPNLYDRLQDLLLKALNLYFNRYPQRNLLGLDCFFLDPEVSRQVGSYILERKSINWDRVQEAFKRQLNSNKDTLKQLENQNLNYKQIIEDFIECYRQVLREQLSLPQVVILLEILNQSENLIAEFRASEQRIRDYIAQLQTNQLSSQNLNLAYQNGQQQLAHNLTEEMGTVGLLNPDQALQVIQARLDPTPALFDIGLCKGRQLSANPNEYFVSHGFDSDLLADWRKTLEETLAQTNEQSEVPRPYFSGDTLLGGFRLCGLCEKLHTTRFSMFLLPPSQDRNVYLELGIAIGLGTPFFLVQHYEADIPKILDGLTRYTKGGLFRTMRRELGNQIEEYDFGVVHFTANLTPANRQKKYLIAAGELIEDEDFEGSIIDAVNNRYPHLEAISLTEQLGASNSGWMLEQLIESIQTSRFAIYRVDEKCSPTTFLALGISIGLNRPFLMINRTNREVPVDLRGMGIYQFPNFVTLEEEIISRHQSFFARYN